MDNRLRKCVGDKPVPFDDEKSEKIMIYPASGLSLYICKRGVNFSSGTIAHSDYEFFLPLSDLPPVLKIDGQKRRAQHDHLFPFNPGQAHGLHQAVPLLLFLDIIADKAFVDDICRLIYSRSEVLFLGENAPLTDHLGRLIESFVNESRTHQPGQGFVLDCLSNQIIVELLRNIKNNLPPTDDNRLYSATESINKTVEFLRECYNQEFSLADVAKIANLSPYHFIRIFKAQTGKTPHQYLKSIKIEKACFLLQWTELPITEICFQCGFNDPSHFSNTFKQQMGTTPTMYRRSYQK